MSGRRREAIAVAMALSAAMLVAACADLDHATAVEAIPGPIVNPSWSLDIAPVLGETCATSNACHAGPTPANGLNLEPGQSRANLVNVPSLARPALMRVRPGNPDSSFLYIVTNAVDSVRQGYYRMPLTEYPLPDPVRQTIRNWIADSARAN